MGHQTVVMVLNDAFDQIEKNKEQFSNNVLQSSYMREQSETYSIGNHANPMKIFNALHADQPQLTLAYQNDFVRFGYSSDLTLERHIECRKQLLKVAKRILEDEEREIKELEKKI